MIQAIIGSLVGFGIVALGFWLIFIYPYSSFSLKAFWWGAAVGVGVAALALLYIGWLVSSEM